MLTFHLSLWKILWWSLAKWCVKINFSGPYWLSSQSQGSIQEYFCLLGLFRPTQWIFYLYADVSGLQILTYTRHSCLLSSDGNITCHTHCDIGHPFTMVIFENQWHLHLLPSVYSSRAVTTCFNDLGLSRLGFEHPTFRERSNRLAQPPRPN